jgi:uncharacterized membrane protein
VFWILATAMVALVLGTIGRLPPVVASHFDIAGTPNGWSSRSAYGVLLITMGAVLPAGIIGLVHALTRRGPHLLNIPTREFWTRPEQRQEAVRRVRAHIWWLGSILAGMAGAVHILILWAHASTPPRLSSAGIWVVLCGVILLIGQWTARWYRMLRVPAAHRSPAGK